MKKHNCAFSFLIAAIRVWVKHQSREFRAQTGVALAMGFNLRVMVFEHDHSSLAK